MPDNDRWRFGLWALALSLALFACGRSSQDDASGNLEAVDVEPSISITPEDDPQAVERPPELTGILPQDFPSELPLFLPASLVDFGSRGGKNYVSLLAAASRAKVRGDLESRLKDAGWGVSDSGGGALVLRKGSRRVQLSIRDASPGTLYQFDY